MNSQVNRSIRPRHDKTDVWSLNARSGDCEEYALAKRSLLIKAGLPPSALRMTVVRTASGEGHAVLVVKTDAGDKILDNRTSAIKSWRQSDLTLIKIASANPLQWEVAQRGNRTASLAR